jgi:hypothetical protein
VFWARGIHPFNSPLLKTQNRKILLQVNHPLYHNHPPAMNKIQKRLQAIEQRNYKVEQNKAWETSWTRRIVIAVLTYVTIVLFFFVAQLPHPFINSLVPTTGFVLSTLSLPFFRKLWMQYYIMKDIDNNTTL